MKNKNVNYTCADYQQKMILLGLKNQFNNNCLTDKERRKILDKIEILEYKIGLR